MNLPGNFPGPPSSQYIRQPSADSDDAKRRRVDSFPTMPLPSLTSSMTPMPFPFPPMAPLPGMLPPMGMPPMPESQAVAKLRGELDLLRGHLNALKQENSTLKEDGRLMENKFQENYQKLAEENAKCREEFVVLKSQLDSSTKELTITMESMERSRTDVEAAVESYRSEARNYVSTAAVEQLREQVYDLFTQAQSDSKKELDNWVALVETKMDDVKCNAETLVADSKLQIQANVHDILEDKSLALRHDLVQVLSGEELSGETAGRMLVEISDDVVGAHLEPIRKEIQNILSDRMTNIKSDLMDTCMEQLDAKQQCIADELGQISEEIKRMEALQGELKALQALRTKVDELKVMREDLDSLLQDRKKIFTLDDASLTLAKSKAQLQEMAHVMDDIRAKGADTVRECGRQLEGLKAEWKREHEKQLQDIKERLAQHNKEWCDQYMSRLAAESYENLLAWGESLKKEVVTKQDDCVTNCKSTHGNWIDEYRAELSAFKKDIIRSNKEWGQDYMNQIAAMCEQKMPASIANARAMGAAPVRMPAAPTISSAPSTPAAHAGAQWGATPQMGASMPPVASFGSQTMNPPMGPAMAQSSVQHPVPQPPTMQQPPSHASQPLYGVGPSINHTMGQAGPAPLPGMAFRAMGQPAFGQGQHGQW